MSTTTTPLETGLPTAAEVPAQPGPPDVETVPVEAEAEQPPRTPLLRQLQSWAGYVGCFVGAGLVGGGLVHWPLDPSRYSRLALVGVVLFVLVNVLDEVVLAPERPTRGALLRLLGCSLLLAVGIGMLSGGIQHFSDVRGWSEVMVGGGLVVSWLAHAVRTGFGLRRTAASTAGVVVLAGAVYAGLLHVPYPSDGGHGHGPAAATQEHAVSGEHGPADHGPATEQVPAAPATTGSVDLAEELARLTELDARLEDLRVR